MKTVNFLEKIIIYACIFLLALFIVPSFPAAFVLPREILLAASVILLLILWSIKLVMAPTYHEGLTRLWELERLDLTVEAIIIREPYSELFPEEVVNKAKEKLKQLGYSSI